MERTITSNTNRTDASAISYQKAVAEFDKFEKDTRQTEEVCCTQLLKNLLKTNLKLLKLNEISSMLMF